MSNDHITKAYITYCLRELRRSPDAIDRVLNDLEYKRFSSEIENAEEILRNLKEYTDKNPDTPQIATIRKFARGVVEGYLLECDDKHKDFQCFVSMCGYERIAEETRTETYRFTWIMAQEWDKVTGQQASKTYTIPKEHAWRYHAISE